MCVRLLKLIILSILANLSYGETSNLDVSSDTMDLEQNRIIFTGKVKIKFHDIVAYTAKAIVYLKKNKEIDYVVIPTFFIAHDVNKDSLIKARYAKYDNCTNILHITGNVIGRYRGSVIASKELVYHTALKYIQH